MECDRIRGNTSWLNIFISPELSLSRCLGGSAPSSGGWALRRSGSRSARRSETLIRLLANDMISQAGYRVLEARDGQEALTILEVHADVRALFDPCDDAQIPPARRSQRSSASAGPRLAYSSLRGWWRRPNCPTGLASSASPMNLKRCTARSRRSSPRQRNISRGAAPVALTSIPESSRWPRCTAPALWLSRSRSLRPSGLVGLAAQPG